VSIEGLRSEQWPAWRTFLSDYEQVCRNVDQLQRTLFFAQMDSEWDPAPVEDVCLAVFSWDDTLDETDISLFAARQLISKRLAPLERRLIISLLSELSLWDTVLCVQLANHSLETLIVPERQLQTFAHQRGWTAAIPRAQWWNFGIEASVVGFRQKHSAFLALLGEERALGQRIWRAQLRVVFPAIEELRLALLPCLKPQLRFPLATASGLVHEIEELEIGEIAYHLQKTRSVDPEIRRLVHLLKDLRHALAHLEPIRDGTRLRRLCQAHEQLLYRSTNSA
jgi:hypothetical protein